MIVLVPVRYPLNGANRRAIEKGRELVAGHPDPELLIVHLNRSHRDEHVSRSDLQAAVESEFGDLPAHYVVRDGLFYEEAILNEAVRHEVDHVVLSERRYGAWKQLVRSLLDRGRETEAFLAEQLDAEIHVVTDGDDAS